MGFDGVLLCRGLDLSCFLFIWLLKLLRILIREKSGTNRFEETSKFGIWIRIYDKNSLRLANSVRDLTVDLEFKMSDIALFLQRGKSFWSEFSINKIQEK